jgi:hypothetical protein
MEPEGTLPPYPESINPVLTLTRISSWYILILFSHLRPYLPSCLHSGFPTKIVYIPFLTALDLSTIIVFGEQYEI